MKNFITLIFILSLTCSLTGQVVPWLDYATFTPECEDPIQTIPDNGSDFNFTVGFGTSLGAQSTSFQVERSITFVFKDGDGNAIKDVDFTSFFTEWEEFGLNSTHLEGLPVDVPIYVDMFICYKYVNDELGQDHNVKLIANGEEICAGELIEEGDQFCCVISEVLCFQIIECDEFSVFIQVNYNFETMKAIISGDPGEYSFSWTYTEFGSEDLIQIGNGQNIDFDRCDSGVYCVTVTEIETGCQGQDCVTYAAPLDCEPCLIAEPTNLLAQDYNSMGTILSWDPAPGAEEYVVNILFNDPACCPDAVGEPYSKTIFTQDTYTILFNTLKLDNCFSWTVTALCPGFNGSATSDRACGKIKHWFPFNGMKREGFNLEANLKISPNPILSVASIEVSNFKDVSANLYIYGMDGRLVDQFSINSNQNIIQVHWPLNVDVPNGVYFINILSEHTRLVEKIVVHR